MKPIVDVKTNACIDFDVENNDKVPELKVVSHVRMSKYKNIFAESYTPNLLEEISVVSDFNSNEIVGIFYKKVIQKTTKLSSELKK